MSKRNKDLRAVKINNFFKNNKFFLIIVGLILVAGSFAYFSTLNSVVERENLVYGDDVIDMYFFHLSTCPHCHAQIEFHPTILEQYPNVRIIEYEITRPESVTKYKEMAALYEELDPDRFPGTPLNIIGDEVIVGFGTPETSGVDLLRAIQVEQDRIDSNWDDSTMIRTVDLRAQANEVQE